MKALTVFRGVPIPVDYASTQTYALLAKRDGGKTYTTLKFEEQMCDAGLFFVTLDPVGKHWALRAGADGGREGGKQDVWVLGGAHGDAPLEPTAGEVIADTVIEHPGRYVLDVSGFETDADQDRFALAFAKRLFRRKAKSPGFPLLLILEEAEAFIPERPQSGQQAMLGAFGRIMRQGRNHGLGMWMVAQRAQALNKGVLSQAEVLVVKQMAHKRDRDAVADWVKANGTPEQEQELMASLAGLAREDAWVWSPSWLRVFKHARVLPRTTFDSSASVKGGATQKAVELVPLDVAALGERIASTRERAKAGDPKELRRQIAELRKELRDRPAPEPEKVEVPVLDDEAREELRDIVGQVSKMVEDLAGVADTIGARLAKAAPEPARHVPQRSVRPAVGGRGRRPAGQRAPGAAVGGEATPAHRSASPEEEVPPSRQRVLDALAALEQIGVPQADKTQLALFAQASPKSSGYTNNLGALRSAGLIDYPASRLVTLTDEGRTLAVADSAPSTVGELHAYVQRLLPSSRWRIVEALIAVYPDGLPKDELAERAEQSPTSSGYTNNLGALRSLGLIDKQPGQVTALPILFLEGAVA